MFIILFALYFERDYSGKINIDDLVLRHIFSILEWYHNYWRWLWRKFCIYVYCGVHNFISTPSKIK